MWGSTVTKGTDKRAHKAIYYYTKIWNIRLNNYELVSPTESKGAITAKSVYWPSYRLNNPGFKNQQCVKLCSSPILALGTTHPPIQWVPQTLSLGVKWPEHVGDHLSPPSARVKNEWSCTSTPPTCLHAMYRDNIIFNITFIYATSIITFLIGFLPLVDTSCA